MNWVVENWDTIIALATSLWAYVERRKRKSTAEQLQQIRIEAGTAATDLPRRR